MTIYIDSDFKCHTTDDGTLRAVETDFFDGKCRSFIEGYRFVPAGESWVRSDGQVFCGEMISPWRDYGVLAQIQSAVDDAAAEADEVLASLIEEVYRMDSEMMEA